MIPTNHPFWNSCLLLCGALLWPATTQCLAAPADAEYLSDSPGLMISTTQSWGVMGLNGAAHKPGKPGEPMRIGSKSYAKGIGHHAKGSLTVLLDGAYASFDAEVGLQPCGSGGSVIFRVFVDGQQRFDSGVMRASDAPKPVRVPLDGAAELRLEVGDAGDGITCDSANWADARFTHASGAARQTAQPAVDIARFARVATWDPNRKEGCRAKRTEEFLAEDVFLETDLAPNAGGAYSVPVATNGLGCVGLQWLNQRLLRELSLQFADPSQMPAPDAVRVEQWIGESAWQGQWVSMAGEMSVVGERLVFRPKLSAKKMGDSLTRKVRWILPVTAKPVVVRGLSAFSRAGWAEVKLVVQADQPAKDARGELSICNGEAVGEAPTQWELSQPLHLTVRYSRSTSLKTDPTVLQFRLPTGAFGVAVQDVLTNDCVYLPEHGLFVARDPAPVSLADYKKKVAAQKTVLQHVREMPDQTREQALKKTHHDFQENGPVMLSLAGDNTKFIVSREGNVRFRPVSLPQAALAINADHSQWIPAVGEMRPQFGRGAPDKRTRRLDGGWLPVPVITVEKDGIVWRQRTFVAPRDNAGSQPARLNRPSVCVTEFTLTNTKSSAANASLALSFLAKSGEMKPAQLAPCARGFTVSSENIPTGLIVTDAAAPLQAQAKNEVLLLSGTLPAGASARCVVYLASEPGDLSALADADRLRAEVEAYWKAVLAPATQIETPDEWLNNLIRSSQVRCLIATRNEADGARFAPWIAAMVYGPLESEAHSIIRGMDLLGHGDFARRSLDFFIHRYNSNGFLTTGYTTFGTPWHLWTLGEHYQLNRDTDWLRRVTPEITRVSQWSMRQIEKTKKLDAHGQPLPESGLMPPGVLADWNAFAYHFCMSAYYHAALREVGTALSDIQDPQGAVFTQAAAELRANLLRAYQWTQARSPAVPLRNGAWVPFYPSQLHSPGKLADFFPGQDDGRSWAYDVEVGAHQLVAAGVFDAQDREVERMMDHMEDVQFLDEGWFDYPAVTNHADWFNLGGFSKVQPYYTRNGEIYALRDDVKPFIRSYFNSLASLVNLEVLTFWEHFHGTAAWDKTHETGYFLQQTRFMLVMEHGDELRLAPLITSNWMKDGLGVAVANAPTRFGPVSYRLTSRVKDSVIEARIEPPVRSAPKAIVLRLRHPDGKAMRAVTVNGKPHTDFDASKEIVRLPASQGPIRIIAEFDK